MGFIYKSAHIEQDGRAIWNWIRGSGTQHDSPPIDAKYRLSLYSVRLLKGIPLSPFGTHSIIRRNNNVPFRQSCRIPFSFRTMMNICSQVRLFDNFPAPLIREGERDNEKSSPTPLRSGAGVVLVFVSGTGVC